MNTTTRGNVIRSVWAFLFLAFCLITVFGDAQAYKALAFRDSEKDTLRWRPQILGGDTFVYDVPNNASGINLSSLCEDMDFLSSSYDPLLGIYGSAFVDFMEGSGTHVFFSLEFDPDYNPSKIVPVFVPYPGAEGAYENAETDTCFDRVFYSLLSPIDVVPGYWYRIAAMVTTNDSGTPIPAGPVYYSNGFQIDTPTDTPLSETPSDTPTDTPADTPTNTPTETETYTPANTPTNTPTETETDTPAETPTNTPTETEIDTPAETYTETPTETLTNTPTETQTSTQTYTPTFTLTNTPADSPTNTETSFLTPTFTATNSPSATPSFTPTPPETLLYVVDNTDPGFSVAGTNWLVGTSARGRYGANYRYNVTGMGNDKATWQLMIPVAGNYSVSVWYPDGQNPANNAPYTVNSADGAHTIRVDQGTGGGRWNLLGQFAFNQGSCTVVLGDDAQQYRMVLADAVKWSQTDATPTPTSTPISADWDDDGEIDGEDLSHFYALWGTNGGDLNGDGVFNSLDLFRFALQWNP